jgi:hypothetical protein
MHPQAAGSGGAHKDRKVQNPVTLTYADKTQTNAEYREIYFRYAGYINSCRIKQSQGYRLCSFRLMTSS